MIEGVLDYSAISAVSGHFEPVDLNQTIRNVQTDLELVIQQRSAIMNIGPLPVIHGAPILIHQLFFNLVNNSLKFTRKDIAPIITIAAASVKEQGRGLALITVRDNGIGFDQQHAESIFTTFARLNSKDLFEGTGLGLALSKKIVERHGGSISAQSKLGEGATFTIKLPLEHSTDRSQ
jgi:light-regulated signal transduction histidine kinase (bacteriophytochrome)